MKEIKGYTPGDWVIDGEFIIGGVNKESYNGHEGVVICDFAPETEYLLAPENQRPINAELIAAAPSLYEENIKLREQLGRLKGIARTVRFWFSNEANYPEGTNGYIIVKDIDAALKQTEQ